MKTETPKELPDTTKTPREHRMIVVCDACLQASCWQGIFMCQQSQNAGITEKSIAELTELNLEHPCYWEVH